MKPIQNEVDTNKSEENYKTQLKMKTTLNWRFILS